LDTVHFLQACNQLFEKGFLSHDKISTTNQQVLEQIETGLRFFTDRYRRLEVLKDFQPTNPREKRYMSWQTFDLLRLSAQGFTGFCKQFLKEHPYHYLIPFKINGSAVESYFAQIRQRAGVGAASSVNYPYAAARLAASSTTDLRKRRQSRDDQYRSEELSLKRAKN
jgi:hypothetical protein